MQGRSENQRELLDAEAVAGHLLKPGSMFGFLAEHRPARSAAPDGLTVNDFTVDYAARTATCPNGITREMSRTGVATFKAACTGLVKLVAPLPIHVPILLETTQTSTLAD